MPRSRSAGFNVDALLQRDPTEHTSAPSRRRPARAHALDAEPDHDAALEHLKRATNHISAVRSSSSDFDRERFSGYLRSALEAMGAGAEDDTQNPLIDNDSTAEERHRAATGEDDVGEVPARSAVTLTGERPTPDHRRDFNSMRQRGADKALAFDAETLLQKR